MQIGFYFDQTRCTGCYTCIVACKDWHDVPAGPASWRRVTTFEKGTYPELFVAHLATSCYHCAKPACVPACPAGAISKRESDGVVLVDREACLGHDKCDMCLQVCTYKAPQFGAESNAKMQKCNFCVDRLEEGKQPICVAGCPMRALDSGPIDELKKKYGNNLEAEGFEVDASLCPSTIFKPKWDTKKLKLMRVDVAPLKPELVAQR
ncbi:MAG: 4Fe-4S dicluster domain-containing protein [Chloroflexi bacterium]|nr:4Fe-4S dicluster domain-containing protein [Chloroflexota bacterium]